MVLLINASFLPLSMISVRRALMLLLTGKAEPIRENPGRKWCSPSISVLEPMVVRLLKQVHVPYRIVPLSRCNVWLRDDFTCQYCGERCRKKDLTVDHVLPKSRDGETVWTNVVACCFDCNHRKGSRTPKEARMALLHPPAQPTMYTLLWAVGERFGLY